VPIKTYEYMASGRPVLASPLPGVMRDVPPGNGVLYVSEAELPAALAQLLDADVRRALGRKAREFVEAHCDWDRLADEFEALISELAGQ
jgi:glycosyltransferase involved in cell wall biosynthesis